MAMVPGLNESSWTLKHEEYIGDESELDENLVENSLDFLNYYPFKADVKEDLPLLELAEKVCAAAEEVAINHENYDTVECFLWVVDLMMVDAAIEAGYGTEANYRLTRFSSSEWDEDEDHKKRYKRLAAVIN